MAASRSRSRRDRSVRPQRSRQPTPAIPGRASAPWWHVAVIGLAGAVVYANSLWGVFLFDDFGGIVRNAQITNLWNVRAIWIPPADTPVAGRPLAHLSFALNYALGGLDVVGFHVVNIGLHIGCAWLVYALVRWTLEHVAHSGLLDDVRAAAGTLALTVAVLWVVHPLNTEVVDYISQRTESLMAICYLTAVYAAARAWRSSHRAAWLVTAVGACVTGAWCKESIATAPLIIALYDRVFVVPSFAEAVKARWRFYLCLTTTWLVLAGQLALHGQTSASLYSTAPTSPWIYLLNQTEMIPHYLRLTVWPRDLVLFYGWPKPLTLGDVWPTATALMALVGLSVVAFIKRPRLGFAALWFFITLAPTSSVIPLSTEVGAERRMYLPLVGLLALIVVGSATLWTRSASWRQSAVGSLPRRRAVAVGVSLVMLAAVALSAATIARNREYDSALGMAETIAARWPSPGAEYLLGSELAAAGQHDDAIAHLRTVVDSYPPAGYVLGAELFKTGHLDEAIARLDTLIRLEPRLPIVRPSRIMIARARELKQDWPGAIDECNAVLKDSPEDPDAHGLIADALEARQDFAGAIPHYRLFLPSQPTNTAAWTSLGVALVATNRGAEAIDAFRHAAESAPTDGHLRQNLARALIDQGRLADAATEATRAVTLLPDEAASHELLGRVFAAESRIDEARRELQRALAIDPSSASAIDAMQHLPIRQMPDSDPPSVAARFRR